MTSTGRSGDPPLCRAPAAILDCPCSEPRRELSQGSAVAQRRPRDRDLAKVFLLAGRYSTKELSRRARREQLHPRSSEPGAAAERGERRSRPAAEPVPPGDSLSS